MKTDIFSNNNYSLPQYNSPFGVRADASALPQDKIKVQIPPLPEESEVTTLNNHGFMKLNLDEFSKEFINYSIKEKGPVMDVGAAYGVTVIPILKAGSAVIANDIEPRHLLLIRENTPKKLWSNLYLNDSRFPQDIDLPDNSLSAILMCRVAHFFTPEEMELAFNKAHKFLKKGGKIFFVIVSPYHARLKGFSKIYDERWSNGDRWPGVIQDMHKYVLPHKAAYVPKFFHAVDERPIKIILKKYGFRTEKMSLFDYPDEGEHIVKNKGSYFGVIATK